MSRSLWRHLGVLVLLGALLTLASGVSVYNRGTHVASGVVLEGAVFYTLTSLLPVLAIVPGIAVGTGAAGRPGVRSAVGVLAAVMIAMVVIDTIVAPAVTRAAAVAARTDPRAWPLPSDSLAMQSPVERDGVIRSGLRLATERPRALDELQERYALDHPRSVATSVVTQIGFFVLPFVAMGVVLGAFAWVRRHVTFRSSASERVARWAMAWVLAPAVVAVFANWPMHMQYELLFRGASLWRPALAMAPFVVLAALGWRAAAREPAGVAPAAVAA